MYINIELLDTKGLGPSDLLVLQLLKQNKFENMAPALEGLGTDRLDTLTRLDLIHEIKGTKKQSYWEKLRLTKKGTKVLEDCQTPGVTEEDIILYDWIKGKYIEKGKQVGNMKQSKINLAKFRVESGLRTNRLAKLIEKYTNDELEQEYSHILEYVFFKPSNMFQSKFDIHQSRLYNYYLKNRQYFDRIFLTIPE